MYTGIAGLWVEEIGLWAAFKNCKFSLDIEGKDLNISQRQNDCIFYGARFP